MEHSHQVSQRITEAISLSGAYLRDAHRFSDMRTTFNIWDLPPVPGIAILGEELCKIGAYPLVVRLFLRAPDVLAHPVDQWPAGQRHPPILVTCTQPALGATLRESRALQCGL